MSSHIQDGRRPVVGARAVHRENARIREIAQLRARRAARLANERAAGRRRMLSAAASAAATLVVGILAALSVLAWVWVALPAALLVAALGASRWAAVRSEAAGRREDARLRELREGLGTHHGGVATGAGVPRAAGPAARGAGLPPVTVGHADEGGAGVPDRTGDHVPTVDTAGPVTTGAVTDPVGEGSAPVAPQEASGEVLSVEVTPTAEEPSVDIPEERPTDLPVGGPGHDVVDRAARGWSVAAVPAPTYASRARVAGREVHADTDLRGIPAVSASVPGRPNSSADGGGTGRSTAEVAASQPVVFDLDAVLDNRRAQ